MPADPTQAPLSIPIGKSTHEEFYPQQDGDQSLGTCNTRLSAPSFSSLWKPLTSDSRRDFGAKKLYLRTITITGKRPRRAAACEDWRQMALQLDPFECGLSSTLIPNRPG